MINLAFSRNKNNDSDDKMKMGLVKEVPVLMQSIAASYVYLDSLCSIASGLSYERLGGVPVSGFPNVVDKYHFTLNGNFFCEIFVYAYHPENLNFIPTPFKELNPNVSNEIFVQTQKSKHRYMRSITHLVLVKNGYADSDFDLWNPEKQILLTSEMSELGYEIELELLILDSFKVFKTNHPTLKILDFINEFTRDFHNIKLVPYTPDFIQERNERLLKSYDAIIETINRIQAWQDNDLLRNRIEIDTNKGDDDNSLGVIAMKNCITPFCFISVGCDVFGRYNMSYGIESQILKMISDNMASTLLRRIYEFTSGEMEPFVGFVSLSMDCISYFESTMKNVENENYTLIEVKRNEEKSIADLFNNLEFKDDVDEVTKRWMRR